MFDVFHAVNLGGESYRGTDGVRYASDPAGLGVDTSSGRHTALYSSGIPAALHDVTILSGQTLAWISPM